MTTSLLVGARPGSWHGRSCHGADKPMGHMDGGGSDVAGTMGRLGDVPGGVLRVVLVWRRASRAGSNRRHCMIPVIAGPSRRYSRL